MKDVKTIIWRIFLALLMLPGMILFLLSPVYIILMMVDFLQIELEIQQIILMISGMLFNLMLMTNYIWFKKESKK